jgi:regulatory protein
VTSRGNAVRVLFADGSSVDLPPDVLFEHDLQPGFAVSAELRRSLGERAQARDAEERALKLLGAARHTRAGLRSKLQRRGFPAAAVERALDHLSAMGYLDDAATAEGWVRRRLERRPEGRGALLAGLLRHGVGRDDAARVVDAALPAEDEAQAAVRLLHSLYRSEGAFAALAEEPERGRALRRLLARGFSRRAARGALPARRTGSEQGDEE